MGCTGLLGRGHGKLNLYQYIEGSGKGGKLVQTKNTVEMRYSNEIFLLNDFNMNLIFVFYHRYSKDLINFPQKGRHTFSDELEDVEAVGEESDKAGDGV